MFRGVVVQLKTILNIELDSFEASLKFEPCIYKQCSRWCGKIVALTVIDE